MELPAHFWTKVDKDGPNGCWLWTGSKGTGGYGMYAWTRNPGEKRFSRGAHRLAYMALVGEIPDGLDIDHLCRVRHCVNPAHLEAVSTRTNLLRGNTFQAKNAAKTHCAHGHPFDLLNTRWSPRGQRRCIECDRTKKVAS